MTDRAVLAVTLLFVISVFGADTPTEGKEPSMQTASAQENPVPAPPDVIFTLKIEGNRDDFHLGELIPITFAYSATTAEKYVQVRSDKLAGGRPIEISRSPAVESAIWHPDPSEAMAFQQMLHSPCGGVGGGIGGGCGDCDGEIPLSTTPVSFGVLPLNSYIRFRRPGTYRCEASSAEITSASRDEKVRPALLVTSNPISLTIGADPAWSRAALISYTDGYDRSCRGDDVGKRGTLQCFDMAERITYLDTPESLAAEIKRFDGQYHGWDNGFWHAILVSSYPREAVRLLASRIPEPDFQVSTETIEWLASTELRVEHPDAFQSSTPAIYHDEAVEKLRKYVRLLGSSLSNKNRAVFAESVKTYRWFAEQDFCERQPLIAKQEREQLLSNIGFEP